MTPKEQAIDIVNSMGFSTSSATSYTSGENYPIYKNQYAKDCAIIAANKIYEVAQDDSHLKHTDFSKTHVNYKSYWKLVIEEIENL